MKLWSLDSNLIAMFYQGLLFSIIIFDSSFFITFLHPIQLWILLFLLPKFIWKTCHFSPSPLPFPWSNSPSLIYLSQGHSFLTSSHASVLAHLLFILYITARRNSTTTNMIISFFCLELFSCFPLLLGKKMKNLSNELYELTIDSSPISSFFFFLPSYLPSVVQLHGTLHSLKFPHLLPTSKLCSFLSTSVASSSTKSSFSDYSCMPCGWMYVAYPKTLKKWKINYANLDDWEKLTFTNEYLALNPLFPKILFLICIFKCDTVRMLFQYLVLCAIKGFWRNFKQDILDYGYFKNAINCSVFGNKIENNLYSSPCFIFFLTWITIWCYLFYYIFTWFPF